MAGQVGRVGGPLPIDFMEPPWAERRRVFLRERHRFNYANWIDILTNLYRRRTAFVLDRPIEYPGFSGEVISYLDLRRMVCKMASALRDLGVERGDRVGMITMNRIEMAFCNFAAARIGAIPVPMNFMLRANEIDFVMRRSGAEVLVCDRSVWDATIKDAASVPAAKRWIMIGPEDVPEPCVAMRDLMDGTPDYVAPVPPVSDDDTAILFFTSGTTGFPKGAMISHAGTMVGLRSQGRLFALPPRMRPMLSLLVMPVAHAGGYAAMLLQLAFGTPAFFISRFDPKLILDCIERYRATMMSGTPAMYRMLLEAGARERDLTSIRIWAGGADAFPDSLITTFRELATRPGPMGRTRKPWFIRGYGMAEANSFVSNSPPFECGDNCVGWVLPPVKFRIVDEEGRDVPRGRPGELLLRGPNVTRGYWNDPEATELAFLDGWFRTGDIVRQGKWRMLYFVDRTGDIIKSGGYKIAAAEIDQTLTQHPDVEHAATVGVPDAMKGQRPMSAIVLRADATSTPDEILAWARERIAPYKCPRRVFVMPDLPFTFSLKPKRREVRERLSRILDDEAALGAPHGGEDPVDPPSDKPRRRRAPRKKTAAPE